MASATASRRQRAVAGGPSPPRSRARALGRVGGWSQWTEEFFALDEFLVGVGSWRPFSCWSGVGSGSLEIFCEATLRSWEERLDDRAAWRGERGGKRHKTSEGYDMSCRSMTCYVMPCHVIITCLLISYHIISCHLIYVHTYMHTYEHTSLPTYLTYLPTHLPIYVHTVIHSFIHSFTRTYINTYFRPHDQT